MIVIDRCILRWEELSWERVEKTAKYLTTPKSYLKIGEIIALWGKYILPSFTNECENVIAFIKSCSAPFVLLETISATCNFRTYTLKTQDGKYEDFGSAFAHGVVAVGSFVGKSFRSIVWLDKMQAIILMKAIVFRLGVIGSFCLYAKAPLELLMKSFVLLEEVSEGNNLTQDDIVKCMKIFIEITLYILSLGALYQTTGIGAFLSLLFGTCATILDFV